MKKVIKMELRKEQDSQYKISEENDELAIALRRVAQAIKDEQDEQDEVEDVKPTVEQLREHRIRAFSNIKN